MVLTLLLRMVSMIKHSFKPFKAENHKILETEVVHCITVLYYMVILNQINEEEQL